MHKANPPYTRFLYTILIITLLALASCGGQPAATQAPAAELGNTLWKMTTVNGANAIPDTNVIVYFGPKGDLVGSTGCNFQSGNYSTSGSQIDIQPAVTTPFDCTPAAKAQEEVYVSVLTQASSANVEGDKLTLSNPDNSLVAEFDRLPPQPLAGTSWQLNAYNNGQGALSSPLEGTQITAAFGEDGILSGSAGCNDYSASYKVDGQTITIEPPVSTKKACAEPQGIMEQETAYLNALQSASVYLNLVAALIMQTSDGTLVVTYFASDLK